MIKRFLTVSGLTLLLAAATWLPSGLTSAGEDPGVPDDPNGNCVSLGCW
ncbi:hypothetical protein [Kribbella sp. NPDC006257]